MSKPEDRIKRINDFHSVQLYNRSCTLSGYNPHKDYSAIDEYEMLMSTYRNFLREADNVEFRDKIAEAAAIHLNLVISICDSAIEILAEFTPYKGKIVKAVYSQKETIAEAVQSLIERRSAFKAEVAERSLKSAAALVSEKNTMVAQAIKMANEQGSNITSAIREGKVDAADVGISLLRGVGEVSSNTGGKILAQIKADGAELIKSGGDKPKEAADVIMKGSLDKIIAYAEHVKNINLLRSAILVKELHSNGKEIYKNMSAFYYFYLSSGSEWNQRRNSLLSSMASTEAKIRQIRARIEDCSRPSDPVPSPKAPQTPSPKPAAIQLRMP